MHQFILTLLVLLVQKVCEQSIEAINFTDVIQTNSGPVKGQLLTTINKKMKYSAFKGIPYGKPPIGPLRFAPPQEVDDWCDVLVTTEEPNFCPQLEMFTNAYAGNEDCLYLNVYTPQINCSDETRRAVMVWIYGGSFITGYINSSFYGPDFLLEDDVVVVAMNYRLGPLGFLALNHSNATGNAGLKDQRLALKWVQQNIEVFGGDPNRVTIFGQSSGSISVQYHKLSDTSVGLFHNSIAMSAAALNPFGYHTPQETLSRAFFLGRELGIDTSNTTELLRYLYSASPEDIVVASQRMVIDVDFVPFRPTIEDSTVATDPFLTTCPFSIYESGNFKSQPQMIGFARSETLPFTLLPQFFEIMINLTLAHTKSLNSTPEISSVIELADIIRKDKPQNFDNIDPNLIYKVINVTTEVVFAAGIDQTQKYLVAKNSDPIYYYRLSLDYPESYHKQIGVKFNGTGHMDDLPLIFWQGNQNLLLDPSTLIQSQKMVRMWTNFAKYGNPTPNVTQDPLLTINWPESGTNGYHLDINYVYSVEGRPINHFIEQNQGIIVGTKC